MPSNKKERRLFGEIAVKRGFASNKDIAEALRLQRAYREKHNSQKKLGAILFEKGIINSEDLSRILQEQKPRTSLMAWFCALFGLSR